MKLKNGISSIPLKINQLKIDHAHDIEQARLQANIDLAKHNEALKKEELRVNNELKLQQERIKSETNIENAKNSIVKAKAQEAKLEKIRYSHTKMGQAISNIRSGTYRTFEYLQPLAKKLFNQSNKTRRKRTTDGRRRIRRKHK
jgi:hypothetical protein